MDQSITLAPCLNVKSFGKLLVMMFRIGFGRFANDPTLKVGITFSLSPFHTTTDSLTVELEGVWVTIKPFRTKVNLKAKTGETIAKAPLAGLPVLAYLRCYIGRVREVYAIGRPDRPRSPVQRRPQFFQA